MDATTQAPSPIHSSFTFAHSLGWPSLVRQSAAESPFLSFRKERKALGFKERKKLSLMELEETDQRGFKSLSQLTFFLVLRRHSYIIMSFSGVVAWQNLGL